MTTYVPSALFVYTNETAYLRGQVERNSHRIPVNSVALDALMQDPKMVFDGVGHVVISGSLKVIKEMLRLSMTYGFSVGLVPTPSQKNIMRFYNLPKKIGAAIDLALQADAPPIDLILCNDHILLFKATVGRIPLYDSPIDMGSMAVLSTALKGLFRLKLSGFGFTPTSGNKLNTAASGCMIIQHHKGSHASRLIKNDSAITDGMISTVVSAPFSIVDCLKFIVYMLKKSKRPKKLPKGIGYIKSDQITIETETPADVSIDGESVTRTPLRCKTIPSAVRLNIGATLLETSRQEQPVREIIEMGGLPRGRELEKARKNEKIPFFSYASEERFRDLFISLRDDAQINGIYIVLMVLSTMLATIGLYQDSAAVIIGAMLLAPLMAPIVSFSMGLLRGDALMYKKSLGKIFIGLTIALLASTLTTVLFPHELITDQMRARLNPTLMDLAVAIISGVAAAYSKSYKEILQSLAGVAIAVALVPPLAVAGTGIGRLDFDFFSEAFLLFATNLVGIIIAATLTFRVLGFSPVVKSRRGFGIVFLLLVLIAIPLSLSYKHIVNKVVYERDWQQERFLVNGKYIIVKKASISPHKDKLIIFMEILVRENLVREDLAMLKKKIAVNFSRKIIIRVKKIYIP